MIFVTLGSQKFQFNRLLREVDDLIEQGTIKEEVYAQIGYSSYKPRRFKYNEFLERDEFEYMLHKSDIVITHGGTGAIISAVKKGKKVIAVPRLAGFGEHVDDHQIQLISQFENLNLVCGCEDCNDIQTALSIVKKTKYNTYNSNTKAVLDSINAFLEMF